MPADSRWDLIQGLKFERRRSDSLQYIWSDHFISCQKGHIRFKHIWKSSPSSMCRKKIGNQSYWRHTYMQIEKKNGKLY